MPKLKSKRIAAQLVLAGQMFALAACATPGALPVAAASEWRGTMTVWTVPSQSIKAGAEFFLQVRIAPESLLEQAELVIEPQEREFSVRGAVRFALGTLAPAPAPPVSSAPNPPALGMTQVRSFAVTALRSGPLTIPVLLQSPSGPQKQSELNLTILP